MIAAITALPRPAASASAADQLAEARRAYRQKEFAKATLSRLRGYGRQTHGMRYDADKALRQLSEAKATLDRILGGAA